MAPPDEPRELPCACGKALALTTTKGLLLYCRRCRRSTIEIPWDVLGNRDGVHRFVKQWNLAQRRRPSADADV